MKRYGWIGGAFLIVVLLVTAELMIIANASGYEAKAKAVFAKAYIPKNTVITGDMLEIREVDADTVHPEALGNSDAAVSKRAGMDIGAGEMLLKVKLLSAERGIIEAEDKNRRLFSVEFEGDQANGWQLADGQHVDIIYVPHDSGKESRAPASQGVEAAAASSGGVMVLKSIRIAGLIDEDGKIIDISTSRGRPRYISFEVTEEQAVFLAYAKRNGKLELSCIPGT